MHWNVLLNHRRTILRVAVVFMAFVALPWLLINYVLLLWELEPWGAVDLKQRYDEVQLWFSGSPVYSKLGSAVYPPASYTMLWPLIGWQASNPAKVCWAATMAIALGWLAFLFVKESNANSRLEKAFIVLLPLSMYPTGFAIGHGQLTVHVIAVLVAGLIFVCRSPNNCTRDLVGAALILFALVKPSVSAPFFWLVLFRSSTLRPAVAVILGYAALSLIAMFFQGSDLFSLYRDWGERGLAGVEHGAKTGGYGDVHYWLAALHLKQWNFLISLLVLLALGLWIYLHRQVDLWILLGICALVSRIWTYHRAYDDMLILLPMVTLFRIAKQGCVDNSDSVIAAVLLSIAMMAMLATGFKLLFPAWEPLLKNLQTIVQIILLAFLIFRGRREKERVS